jgi:alkanesulfonate monooxygenase SsuD/methylene tetrahydromethanopterin reductase-like flavin-dependent oxidoreductase (luciferase family)
MAGAAAVTERMRIATGCLLVPLYAPLKLAEDVAVLDCLSNGRFVFGVAPGYVSEEFAAHGVPREERQARFWEALDLLQQAWTQDSFSFDGRFFQVPETSVTPKPIQSPVPIWYGLSGPRSLARAAGRGGVLMPSPRHGIPEIREHLAIWREAGGAVDELPVMREVFVARDDRARRSWRLRRSRICSASCTARSPPRASASCATTAVAWSTRRSRSTSTTSRRAM